MRMKDANFVSSNKVLISYLGGVIDAGLDEWETRLQSPLFLLLEYLE